MNTPALVRISAVESMTGLKRQTIFRMVAAGTFPQPLKLSPRATSWVETEVEEWVAAKLNQRGNHNA